MGPKTTFSIAARLARRCFAFPEPITPNGLGEMLRPGANPRMVSNLVVNPGDVSIPNTTGMSDAVWARGQFLDHDLDLTDANPANGAANIPVPMSVR